MLQPKLAEKQKWITILQHFKHGIFLTHICFTSDHILCMPGRTFWQHLVFMFGPFFSCLSLLFEWKETCCSLSICEKWLDLAWPHGGQRKFFSVFFALARFVYHYFECDGLLCRVPYHFVHGIWFYVRKQALKCSSSEDFSWEFVSWWNQIMGFLSRAKSNEKKSSGILTIIWLHRYRRLCGDS